jgi:hypothetical protein
MVLCKSTSVANPTLVFVGLFAPGLRSVLRAPASHLCIGTACSQVRHMSHHELLVATLWPRKRCPSFIRTSLTMRAQSARLCTYQQQMLWTSPNPAQPHQHLLAEVPLLWTADSVNDTTV